MIEVTGSHRPKVYPLQYCCCSYYSQLVTIGYLYFRVDIYYIEFKSLLRVLILLVVFAL